MDEVKHYGFDIRIVWNWRRHEWMLAKKIFMGRCEHPKNSVADPLTHRHIAFVFYLGDIPSKVVKNIPPIRTLNN